jgi:chromate transporter
MKDRAETIVEATDNQDRSETSLGELARVFLKLGTIAFGGPAAHIAMMHEEISRRRKWVSEERFLDLLGAANLIPGPSSTELAIYLGYERAGWKGLVSAGLCFILPAMLMVLALAWAYVNYGAMPQAGWLLYGIKPVIVAIVIQALWGLFKTAVKGPLLAGGGILVVGLYLAGFNPVLLLFASGLAVTLIQNQWPFGRGRKNTSASILILSGFGVSTAASAGAAQAPFSLTALFLTFLKLGAVVFGSGYVLLAFLRNDFVYRLGWLSDQQILDAVAVGQFTPGPVFTTATFIGYIAAGLSGAILATVGIFLPSFIFVAAVFPVVGMLRRSRWASGFLDGVNVGALGLMAGVTWQLGRAAVIDGFTIILVALALVLVFRFKINSAWLVLAGGICGAAYNLLV